MLALPAAAQPNGVANGFNPGAQGSTSTAQANARALSAARATSALSAAIQQAQRQQQQQSVAVPVTSSQSVTVPVTASPSQANRQAVTANPNQAATFSNAGGSLNTTVTTTPGAPPINLPSVAGGGMDCPVVGLTPGGSGLGGGGALGVSWISSDCNARKLAELLDHLGYPHAAAILLQRHFPEVAEALKVSGGK